MRITLCLLIYLCLNITGFTSYNAYANSAVDTEQAKPVLRVLSYNVNGLPPPVKKGKVPLYDRIAEILRERRAEGTQPHVVLLQEAFDKRTARIAETTGYKYIFKGPGRRVGKGRGNVHWAQATRKSYAQFSDPQKFTGSGLYILSDFPILNAQFTVFDSDMCAGIDCLSNKGIQFAQLDVPFFDGSIEIVNSHFNSRGSAKAPGKITLKAHMKQADKLGRILKQFRTGFPIVVAGDFNTKQEKRYLYFKSQVGLSDAGEVCLAETELCSLAPGTREEEILYQTNDKQFFENSNTVKLEPVWIGRTFDEHLDGKPLSDHLGYEVHYQVETVEK